MLKQIWNRIDQWLLVLMPLLLFLFSCCCQAQLRPTLLRTPGAGTIRVEINSGPPYPEIKHIDQYLQVARENHCTKWDIWGRPLGAWDLWARRLEVEVAKLWSSAPRSAGSATAYVGIDRNGHIMYATIHNGYEGYPMFPEEGLAFVRHFEGNSLFRFPPDTKVNEVHLSIMLFNRSNERNECSWHKFIDGKTPIASIDEQLHNLEVYRQFDNERFSALIGKYQQQLNDPNSTQGMRDSAKVQIDRLKSLQEPSNKRGWVNIQIDRLRRLQEQKNKAQ